MFLSKIWFILVALLAAVAVTAALVAPRPAVQKLEQLEGQRLDRAQYAAEQMLKVDAHRWIDYVAKLGRDAFISESLDSASRGVGELGVIHKTVQQRLRTLVPEPEKVGLDGLVAVDVKGRVIARLGESEGDYKDSMAGVEVIADAVRGYLSDDVWGAGGKLTRVAAAPVLSKNHDRIVGALLVAAETGKRLAQLWSKNLGIDIAMILRGRVVASTLSEAELAVVPGLITQRAKEIADARRTRAIPVPSGADRLLIVAAPFAGQAAEQEAYYALIGRRPARADLASLLQNTTADDLKWGNFPWLPLGIGMLLIIAVGIALQYVEAEGPLGRLRNEVQQLARGEVQKLKDTRYPGKFGGVARDVNAVIERFTHAPAPRSGLAEKDLNAILGSRAGAGDAVSSGAERTTSSLGAPPPPAFATPGPAAFAPPPPPAFATPPPAFVPPMPSAFGPAPSPFVPMPPPTTLPSLPGVALQDTGVDAGAAVASPALNAPLFRAPPAAASDAAAGDAGPAQGSADGEDAHVREVFAEYLATKKNCGESTEGLTLEKFSGKLRQNRAVLVAKYGCKTVRFTVYVKDGRAALKATRVND